jgi:hypothetical protein
MSDIQFHALQHRKGVVVTESLPRYYSSIPMMGVNRSAHHLDHLLSRVNADGIDFPEIIVELFFSSSPSQWGVVLRGVMPCPQRSLNR